MKEQEKFIETEIEEAISIENKVEREIRLRVVLEKLDNKYAQVGKDEHFFYLKAYILYHLKGASVKVLGLFEKSIELNKTNKYAFFYVIYCLYDMGLYEKCLRVLEGTNEFKLLNWRKIKHVELKFCCSLMIAEKGNYIILLGEDYVNQILMALEEDIPYPIELLKIIQGDNSHEYHSIINKIKTVLASREIYLDE